MKSRWTFNLAFVLALVVIQAAVPGWAEDKQQGASAPNIEELRKQAEAGDADAQFNLGMRYANGDGVPKNPKEAVKWWTLAAEQGDTNAQFNLGLCYDYGVDVPKNMKEAIKWYTRAAEQGVEIAQVFLGTYYFFGNEDVPKNMKEAAKWYTRAAEQGDTSAQCYLGLCYANGDGVPKDLIRAYMWSNLAAVENMDAAKNREIIAQDMTPAQIAEAQRLSAAFVPRKGRQSGTSPGMPGDIAMAVPDTATPPKGTGTAFAVTADGYLVTAAHVVAGATRVEVYAGGQSRPATVVAWDVVNDVAVLKVEGAFSPVRLVSSGGLALGMDLFTVGFPNVQVQGAAPKLTKGSLSGLLGPADDPRYFQLSNPIQPGNSGGAVANEKGEVVGVLVATLDLLKTIERTGQAPQNVNFALKSSYVLPLLESVSGVSGKLGAGKTGTGNAYQTVTDATVMVLVW